MPPEKEPTKSKWKPLRPVHLEEYDLDIISAHRELINLIDSIDFKSNELSKSDYLNNSKSYVQNYCTSRRTNFNLVAGINFPVVVKSDDDQYPVLLGFTLISYDVNKIWLFLDAQRKRYSGEFDFIKIVEHTAYRFVQKWSMAFNNELRLKKITDWVINEKKSEPVINNKPKIYVLEWTKPDSDQELKQFSKRLYSKGCFAHEFDFYQAIKNGSKSNWLLNIEKLAYLIHLLVNGKNPKIKVKGSKACFKAAEQLFLDDYLSSKPKFRLTELNSRIQKYPSKYLQDKGFAYTLVKNLS